MEKELYSTGPESDSHSESSRKHRTPSEILKEALRPFNFLAQQESDNETGKEKKKKRRIAQFLGKVMGWSTEAEETHSVAPAERPDHQVFSTLIETSVERSKVEQPADLLDHQRAETPQKTRPERTADMPELADTSQHPPEQTEIDLSEVAGTEEVDIPLHQESQVREEAKQVYSREDEPESGGDYVVPSHGGEVQQQKRHERQVQEIKRNRQEIWRMHHDQERHERQRQTEGLFESKPKVSKVETPVVPVVTYETLPPPIPPAPEVRSEPVDQNPPESLKQILQRRSEVAARTQEVPEPVRPERPTADYRPQTEVYTDTRKVAEIPQVETPERLSREQSDRPLSPVQYGGSAASNGLASGMERGRFVSPSDPSYYAPPPTYTSGSPEYKQAAANGVYAALVILAFAAVLFFVAR